MNGSCRVLRGIAIWAAALSGGCAGTIVLYPQGDFLVSKLGVVAGAYSDTVDGVKSAAAFVYFGTLADRKLDQVTMRHADSLPYVY